MRLNLLEWDHNARWRLYGSTIAGRATCAELHESPKIKRGGGGLNRASIAREGVFISRCTCKIVVWCSGEVWQFTTQVEAQLL